MQSELGVPVLDGVICALIVASGLVKAGLSTSKIRRYRDVEK
jgi:allantoin racemase